MEVEINTNTKTIEVEPTKAGPQGLSAYEVAKKEGFIGTEEEWLTSLKGEKGDKGDTGEQGPQGPIGPQGERGLTGETGPQGATGPKGDTGEAGRDGYVQYTAGDNITIDANNVISASGGESRRYFTISQNTSMTDLVPQLQEWLDYYLETGDYNSIQWEGAAETTIFRYYPLFNFVYEKNSHYISFVFGSFANGDIRGKFNSRAIKANLDNTNTIVTSVQNVSDNYGFTIAAKYRKYSKQDNEALTIYNTEVYTPTGDYNPATKKYVDDSIASAITDALGGSY